MILKDSVCHSVQSKEKECWWSLEELNGLKKTELRTKKCPGSERTWISKIRLSETLSMLNRKENDSLLTATPVSGHGREEPVLNTQPRTFLQLPAPCSEAPLHEGSAASQTVPPVTDGVFKEMYVMAISHFTHTRRA